MTTADWAKLGEPRSTMHTLPPIPQSTPLRPSTTDERRMHRESIANQAKLERRIQSLNQLTSQKVDVALVASQIQLINETLAAVGTRLSPEQLAAIKTAEMYIASSRRVMQRLILHLPSSQAAIVYEKSQRKVPTNKRTPDFIEHE